MMQRGDRILYNNSNKQLYGVFLKDSGSRKITILLDHTDHYAYCPQGNGKEIVSTERRTVQLVHHVLYPGITHDLVRINKGNKQWAWQLYDEASCQDKEYIVICRPSTATEPERDRYHTILNYFQMLCSLPAVHKLFFSLEMEIQFDQEMYKGRMIGVSPNHKYFLFSPSWDVSDYQCFKTFDPTLPPDIRFLSIDRVERPAPVISPTFFHKGTASSWQSIMQVFKRDYMDILRQMGHTHPEDRVTLGYQLQIPDTPSFCVTMSLQPEAVTVEMNSFGDKTNMHYISNLLVSENGPFYTSPPLVYIEEPSVKTNPSDCIQATAQCHLSIRHRPASFLIHNPGLYRKESDDLTIVPPTVLLLPVHFMDCAQLPIKMEIFPVDPKNGCQPKKESDIKDSYLVAVLYRPQTTTFPSTKMEIKTLGWFVPVDKYFALKKNFREMLQYTIEIIAVELGVDILQLDDQSYINIHGITHTMIDTFNLFPEQLEPLPPGSSSTTRTRKPKPLLHPPFFKVLRSLDRGVTLYTDMGFFCLPKILFDAVDGILGVPVQTEVLDRMIPLLSVLSRTIGRVIHELAMSIPIAELMKEEDNDFLKDCTRILLSMSSTGKKMKIVAEEVDLQHKNVSEMATRFIQLFRQHPPSLRNHQDYRDTVRRENIWQLYSRFSRMVFTFYKNYIRDMNTPEGQIHYFDLYMGYVLPFVKINGEEDWTSVKLLANLSLIYSVVEMESSWIRLRIITLISLEERIKMLRVLLWGYNSVFSSTRMYRNRDGQFHFKKLPPR